eukprot:scaffold18201_cov51-Isochrysis_galbana.AAC.1
MKGWQAGGRKRQRAPPRVSVFRGADHLPIMPFEIEVHALPESFRAQQSSVHANDLGALIIDGDRVKVVHCDV